MLLESISEHIKISLLKVIRLIGDRNEDRFRSRW